MWKALSMHPGVYLPASKELNYFGSDKDVHELNRHFSRSQNGLLLGECTPYYLSSCAASQHLRSNNPGMKILMSLRDPVERAWSQFQFDKAIQLRPPHQSLAEALAEKGTRNYDLLVEHGRYSIWIRQYWALFGEENVLILSSTDLKDRFSECFERVEAFLGLASVGMERVSSENITRVPSSLYRQILLRGVRWSRAQMRRLGVDPTSDDYVRRHGPLLRKLKSLIVDAPPPLPNPEDRELLEQLYEEEYQKLAELLGGDILKFNRVRETLHTPAPEARTSAGGHS